MSHLSIDPLDCFLVLNNRRVEYYFLNHAHLAAKSAFRDLISSVYQLYIMFSLKLSENLMVSNNLPQWEMLKGLSKMAS